MAGPSNTLGSPWKPHKIQPCHCVSIVGLNPIAHGGEGDSSPFGIYCKCSKTDDFFFSSSMNFYVCLSQVQKTKIRPPDPHIGWQYGPKVAYPWRKSRFSQFSQFSQFSADGWPAAVFYPFGDPMPYAYAWRTPHTHVSSNIRNSDTKFVNFRINSNYQIIIYILSFNRYGQQSLD
jgi:hypothetical protein